MSYRRAQGMRGLGYSINPTTIWTPDTGYLAKMGTLANGYQYQPQVFSVYDVPGLLLPAPVCTQANQGAFVSQECVDKALDIQQQNFQRTADYNAAFIAHAANAPNQPPPPPASNYVAPAVATPVAPQPVVGAVATPVQTVTPAAPNVLTAPGGYIDKAASFLGSETEIVGSQFPVWGLVAAGAAALFFMGGRH